MSGNSFGWFPEVGGVYEVRARWFSSSVNAPQSRVRVSAINYRRERVEVALLSGVVGVGSRVVLSFDDARELVWGVVSLPGAGDPFSL